MEGRVYRCGWKRAGKTVRAWLSSDKSINVEGSSFDHVSHLLAEAICGISSDGEAVLEFDPPPPISDKLDAWTTPHLVLLGYNESVNTDGRDAGAYRGGICAECGAGAGERSATSLTLDHVPRGDWASSRNSLPQLLFCSDLFSNLLTDAERRVLRLRPVRTPKSKRQFSEVQAIPSIPLVGFIDAKYNPIVNWRCKTCGRRSLHPSHGRFFGTGIQRFVAAADLPKPLPGVMAIGGKGEDTDIVLTAERWRELKRGRGTNGIVTIRVGVVPNHLVVRDPPVRAGLPE